MYMDPYDSSEQPAQESGEKYGVGFEFPKYSGLFKRICGATILYSFYIVFI